MKRKKVLLVIGICSIAILGIATALGFVQSKESIREQKQEIMADTLTVEQSEESIRESKLKQIAMYDKRIKELEEEHKKAVTEEDLRRTKDELMEERHKKMELEIETGTYDYKEEFEVTLNTLAASLADLKIAYERSPERVTKKEKKRYQELEKIYNKYIVELSKENDFNKLLDEIRAEEEEVRQKYR